LQFEPTTSTDNIRVLMATGTCLNPLIVAGDLLAARNIAEDERLIDGALYSIEWDPAHIDAKKYAEKIGATRGPARIVKVLRFMAGEWFAQCKDEISSLNGTVLAQIVGVTRPDARGSTTTGAPVHAAGIDANAATTTYLATNVFSGVAASGTTGQNSTNISFFIGAGPPIDCTVIITVVVSCHQSAGAGTVKIMIGYDDTGGTTYTWSVPEVLVTTTAAIYTLQYQFTHLAANTGAPRVVLGWDSSSAANALSADGYETFQSEYIKR
jgi:hypothetical protein